MNVDKRGVLIGVALGDGYINKTSQRALSVLHGAGQQAYCRWKAERVGWALGGRQINVTKVKNGPGGKYDAYRFGVTDNYFAQVRGWLYPNGQKLITRRVLDMLTPEGLAIWYMDDGHARRNTNAKGFVSSVATNIATMCSEAEVMVVIDWFKDRFDINFNTRCKKTCSTGKQFFIECNTNESKKFASIIAPHVPECMLYKLAHVATLSSHECQTPVEHCTECGGAVYEKRRGGLCPRCYTRGYYRNVRRFKEDRVHKGFYIKTGDEIVRPNGNEEPLEAGDKEPLR